MASREERRAKLADALLRVAEDGVAKWPEWLDRVSPEDAAETGSEAFRGDAEAGCVGFVDIGLIRDATAIAVWHLEDERVALDAMGLLAHELKA